MRRILKLQNLEKFVGILGLHHFASIFFGDIPTSEKLQFFPHSKFISMSPQILRTQLLFQIIAALFAVQELKLFYLRFPRRRHAVPPLSYLEKTNVPSFLYLSLYLFDTVSR